MRNNQDNFFIKNLTRSPLPRVAFSDIKNSALGDKHELSLVFIGNTRSRALNKKFRNKDYSTNILSFTLTKNSGEIFIDLAKCRKEYEKFERKWDNFIAFLFIHGLVHLKGYEHGSTMEGLEDKYLKSFLSEK